MAGRLPKQKHCRGGMWEWTYVITVVFALGLIPSAGPALGYSVKGVTLGERVHFESAAYKSYKCSNSHAFYGNEFAGFTWCIKTESDSEKRGSFKAYYAILHSDDGTIVYVNRSQQPAYWSANEVKTDIDYYSRQIGARPANIIPMPSRPGFPDGKIAIWGDVILERIVDAQSLKLLAVEKNPKLGVLVDFIGDYARSAKNDLPVYRILGGPGFVWSATYDSNGRGTLRFLAIDPSTFYPPIIAGPTIPSPAPQSPQVPVPGDTTYTTIGWWSIIHRRTGDLDGCMASSRFTDGTLLEMASIQSNREHKGWAFFLSNPKWNTWISKKSEHTLRFVSTKPWWGKLYADKAFVLSTYNVSEDFINTIADADNLIILHENSDRLTGLDMKDSEAALKAVVRCVAEHPYTPTPEASSTPQPAPIPEPEQEITLTGTGFFVAPNRLLTNNHVVKDCRRTIEIRYPDQPSSSAFVDGQDPTNDLALLHTDLRSISVASFRLNPRLGEQVASYGFPYSGLLSSTGNFTLGNVSSLTGMGDDTRFLQMSAPIQPGNSGGPLLDTSGNVIGVVVTQLNAIKMMQVGSSIPQNVNFAIQASIVTNFLSVKGISPKVTASTEKPLAASDVAELAKTFTVQIYCQGVERVSSRSPDNTEFSASTSVTPPATSWQQGQLQQAH
jgi:serine protease Do